MIVRADYANLNVHFLMFYFHYFFRVNSIYVLVRFSLLTAQSLSYLASLDAPYTTNSTNLTGDY